MILILTYYVKETVNISESCSYKGTTAKKQYKTELNPKILSGGMFVANVKSLTYQMFLT